MTVYPITPVAKPRMTARDKRGDKRPVVAKYHAFKDECRLRKVSLEPYGSHVIFRVPMPASWSNRKKLRMNKTPHEQTPDVDNFLKALMDAVYLDDSKVWDVRVTKYWAFEGVIEIKT